MIRITRNQTLTPVGPSFHHKLFVTWRIRQSMDSTSASRARRERSIVAIASEVKRRACATFDPNVLGLSSCPYLFMGNSSRLASGLTGASLYKAVCACLSVQFSSSGNNRVNR